MLMREKLQTSWREYGVQMIIVLFGLVAVVFLKAAMLSGAHVLEGKRAPLFELPLFNGGVLNLRDHLEKEVIVLDFWAVWCPPCRKGLPVIEEILVTYASRGVVVYAVNVGDDPLQIQKFLRESGISLPVALDVFGETSELYEVQSIPQTVIIDRDGMVREVHVGVSSGFKQALLKKIDSLLAEVKLLKVEKAAQI